MAGATGAGSRPSRSGRSTVRVVGRLPLPVTREDREARAVAVAEIARQIAAGRYRVPTNEVAAAVAGTWQRER
jgi:hypothetical protein